MFQSINPATGEPIAQYEAMTPAEAAERIAQCDTAFRDWRRTGLEARAERLRTAGQVLRERTDAYARLMTTEMGKPLAQARQEIEKCAWACNYYAEHAGRYLLPEMVETEAARTFITFQPLGVVLAIMPWNFPFWQVFRFAAPALMAGNGVLLKHAPNVCGCARAIEQLMLDAGFPEGLVRALLVEVEQVPAVLDDPRVAAVTLTGSVQAGKAVAAAAGARIKKTVLELGGSDPYLILEDADLEAAVSACATSRLQNSGQSCIAAKRCIVTAPHHAAFEERLVALLQQVRMGDPLDPDTTLGPLARRDLRDDLHRQVQESVAAGARLLLGGAVPDGPGWFYPPTVLTEVGPGMPAYTEELFGPVAAIIKVRNETEAIRAANDTAFGLGAAVFTKDAARGAHLAAEELEAGCCFVNALVRSDPRLPFGGIKESGYGRELSHFGIREFVNVKTVWVA